MAGSNNNKEKTQFFLMARGSLSELDTQLEICKRLNFVSSENSIFQKIEEVGLLLYGLIKSRREEI
ncbi:MAG: four helix bundle protein [Candidatus Auribacterota bacterium]